MITSVQIGNNGRLGNQMFQFAAMVGTAKMRGLDWYLHEEDNVFWEIFNLKNTKKLTTEKRKEIKFQYKETSFYFNPNVFMMGANTDLYGYFQSPVYFLNCYDLVREELTFVGKIRDESKLKMSSYVNENDITCSIHVRRTDYLKTPDYHPTCEKQYYENAKNIVKNSINKKVKFLIFGDDYEWIEKNIFDDDCVIVKNNSAEVDMQLMSMCNIHIIANSSFSWWAAMLGNYNSVIAPKKWFGPKGPRNWDSIYLESWVKI